jgi:NADH-quinone oxidoreductase subunit I
MGGFLNKIQVDLSQGNRVTFRTQNTKYIYTEQYPTKRPIIAERCRVAPRLNINPDTNETRGILSNLCALACLENLIVVTSVRNEQTRRKDLRKFTYEPSRRILCGLREDVHLVDAPETDAGLRVSELYTRRWNLGAADARGRASTDAVPVSTRESLKKGEFPCRRKQEK